MNKKHIGQRVKLARIFYEQKTGNKMTQEILANKLQSGVVDIIIEIDVNYTANNDVEYLS